MTMKMDPALRAQIDQMVAEGRRTVVAAGSSLGEPQATVRVRPETCGRGRRTLARPTLDALDGDRS